MLKFGQFINSPIYGLQVPVEMKTYTSVTLSQKLEMMKPSEEGTLTAQIGQKLNPLNQTVSQVLNKCKGAVLKGN